MANHPDSQIVAEYRERMNAIASHLDRAFNGEQRGTDREVGFVLLVFPFGNGHANRCNYISNGADRADIAILLREMAARFAGQAEVKGTA